MQAAISAPDLFRPQECHDSWLTWEGIYVNEGLLVHTSVAILDLSEMAYFEQFGLSLGAT